MISKRDHQECKQEFEAPFAHAAEASMAEAWEAEQLAGVPAEDPCLIVDTGWDHVRKGSSAVQPGMSATTGRILTFDLSRRNDPGVNSSQVLEKRNFGKMLKNPLITLMMYTQVQLCVSSRPCTAPHLHLHFHPYPHPHPYPYPYPYPLSDRNGRLSTSHRRGAPERLQCAGRRLALGQEQRHTLRSALARERSPTAPPTSGRGSLRQVGGESSALQHGERCRAERGPRRTVSLSLSTSGSSSHSALHIRSVVSIISSLDITRSSAFIKACRPCRSTSARRSSGNLSGGGSENAPASRSLDDGPAFTLASAAPLGVSSGARVVRRVSIIPPLRDIGPD